MSLMKGIYIQPMDYEVEIYTDFSFVSSDSIGKLILVTVSEFHSTVYLIRTNVLGTLPKRSFHQITICNIKNNGRKTLSILSVYSHPLCYVTSGTCSLIFK